MATAAYLPWPADRYTPCVRTIRVAGHDLTGVAMRMEVRLRANTPGAPLIALTSGVAAGAQGMRVVDVEVVDTIPTSVIEVRINKEVMEDLPFSGEVGDATLLEYDWIWHWGTTAARRRLYGAFPVLAGVTGADDAPLPDDATPYRGHALAPWGEATLTIDDGDVRVEIDDLDRLRALIDTVRTMLEAETAAAIAAFEHRADQEVHAFQVESGAALTRFGEQGRGLLDGFGTEAARITLDFTARTEGRLAQVEAQLLEVLAQGGVAAAGPLIDLTNPGLSGLLPLRTDGLDPDGTNADRINATFAFCASAGLPLGVPDVQIAVTKTLIIPSGLRLKGSGRHAFVKRHAGRLTNTVGQAHDVRIEGMRWRGVPEFSGPFFYGAFTDSEIFDLEHVESFGSGLAIAFGRLERTQVYRPKVRGMPAVFGAGGIRWSGGGIDSTIYYADAESYDDANQLLPAAGELGISYENCGFVDPRGVSAGARGLIIGTNPNTNCWMRNVFAIRGTWSGGGWGVRLGAKGHFRYAVTGRVQDGVAVVGFSGIAKRPTPPLQATEVVRITSPSTPGFLIVGVLEWRRTTTFSGRLVFNAAAKTVAAPDVPNAFALIPVGAYIKALDDVTLAETGGPNHLLFSRVAGKISDNVLLLETAPVADEDNATYTLTDGMTVAVPAPGMPDGPLPADAVIRRNVIPMIDGLTVTGVIDDAPGIRNTAASMAGYIRRFDIDLTILNPRVKLFGINDGAPEPSRGRLRISSDQAPTAPNPFTGQALIDCQYTIGTEIHLDAVTAPGQDGVLVRSITEYDEDEEDVIYNTSLAQSMTVSGTISGLGSQMAAVRAVDNVKRVKIREVIVTAAPGVTDARLAYLGTGVTGSISGCDLEGIAAGNSFETAIRQGIGTSVAIAPDNVGMPGYTLLPGAVKSGTLAAGATTIVMDGSVPASLVTRLDLELGGVMQRAGVDFTTNGTTTLTLSAPVEDGTSFSLRHRV